MNTRLQLDRAYDIRLKMVRKHVFVFVDLHTYIYIHTLFAIRVPKKQTFIQSCVFGMQFLQFLGGIIFKVGQIRLNWLDSSLASSLGRHELHSSLDREMRFALFS